MSGGTTGELFVELRCEEIPASMIRPVLEGLRAGIEGLLGGVEHGRIRTWATPRRFAVAIDEVALARPVVERLITGPPADRAFEDGKPTRMAEGFARGKGVDVSELQTVQTPRGEVVAARVREGGERTRDMVAAGLASVILALPFKKQMEWGSGGVRFGRPLHQVIALFAGEVVPGGVAGVRFGRATLGHRLAPAGEADVRDAESWLEALRERWVEPDLDLRTQRIRTLLQEAVDELGADPIDDPDLLEEVTHLVEWPVRVLGTFDAELLELPPRLLVESMRVHQRYFPVHRDGRLTNHFVVISNNPLGDAELVAEGNARVLRARFYDARFFFAEDQKKSLDAHGWGLGRMRWIRGLGTMADKQERVAELAARLAPLCGATPEAARRAGVLSKCDLTTSMVGEFPKLQGHMGNLYARANGESADVARAIEEHYLPRYAGDELPASPAGRAVALADRLDTLVGCFGIGMIPKGGGDPQGLRRAAGGILAILDTASLETDLEGLFRQAVEVFHDFAISESGRSDGRFEAWQGARGTDSLPQGHSELLGRLVDFALARFKAALVSEGVTADLVDAVIAVSSSDPRVISGKVSALRGLIGTSDFEPILHTFKRVLNMLDGAKKRGRDLEGLEPPARDILEGDAERILGAALDRAAGDISERVTSLDFAGALREMVRLHEPVASFFDAVLVDDPDPSVRARRLGLLHQVSEVFGNLADFSRISTR